MRSTVTGLAPATTGGTSVCTCACAADASKTIAKAQFLIEFPFLVGARSVEGTLPGRDAIPRGRHNRLHIPGGTALAC
jgi:hypothetical protein